MRLKVLALAIALSYSCGKTDGSGSGSESGEYAALGAVYFFLDTYNDKLLSEKDPNHTVEVSCAHSEGETAGTAMVGIDFGDDPKAGNQRFFVSARNCQQLAGSVLIFMNGDFVVTKTSDNKMTLVADSTAIKVEADEHPVDVQNCALNLNAVLIDGKISLKGTSCDGATSYGDAAATLQDPAPADFAQVSADVKAKSRYCHLTSTECPVTDAVDFVVTSFEAYNDSLLASFVTPYIGGAAKLEHSTVVDGLVNQTVFAGEPKVLYGVTYDGLTTIDAKGKVQKIAATGFPSGAVGLAFLSAKNALLTMTSTDLVLFDVATKAVTSVPFTAAGYPDTLAWDAKAERVLFLGDDSNEEGTATISTLYSLPLTGGAATPLALNPAIAVPASTVKFELEHDGTKALLFMTTISDGQKAYHIDTKTGVVSQP